MLIVLALLLFIPSCSAFAVGNVPLTLSVNQGQTELSVPVPLPKNFPVLDSLNLAYDSSSAGGFIGLGWNLQGLLSSITRCAGNTRMDGRPSGVKLDSQDRYCLDGAHLHVVEGNYGAPDSRYRTNPDRFMEIEAKGERGSGPAWFKVRTKEGMEYHFGETAESQFTLGADTVTIWYINSAHKQGLPATNVSFSWRRDDNFAYLDKISHQHLAVQMRYEARPDVREEYRHGGLAARMQQRLKNITVFYSQREGQSLHIEYEAIKEARISVVAVIKLCAQSQCLKPLEFQYAGRKDMIQFGEQERWSAEAGRNSAKNLHVLVDVNRDGLPDDVVVPLDSIKDTGLVTCSFTIDNYLLGIWYNGVDIKSSVTGDLNSWMSVKTVKFQEVIGAKLALQGQNEEPATGASTCSTAGLLLSCTSVDPKSQWHGLVSDLGRIRAFGAPVNAPPAGWTDNSFVDSAFTKLCGSSSLFSMAGAGSAQKVWASDKFGYFLVNPYPGPVYFPAAIQRDDSWEMAREMCTKKGMGLCSRSQICPVQGPPSGGWVPISDEKNDWVWGPCIDHIATYGSGPWWGNKEFLLRNRDPTPWKGYLACCMDTSGAVFVSMNSGNGSFLPQEPWGSVGQWTTLPAVPTLVDADGDGIADLVVIADRGIWVGLNIPSQNKSSGFDFGPYEKWSDDFNKPAPNNPSENWQEKISWLLQDFNGDGLPDFILFDETGVWVGLGTGNHSFLPAAKKSDRFGYNEGWRANHSRFLEDVNNDGLLDIVGISSLDIMCAINTGATGVTCPPSFPFQTHGFSDDAVCYNNQSYAAAGTGPAFSWCALPNAPSSVTRQIPQAGRWCLGATITTPCPPSFRFRNDSVCYNTQNYAAAGTGPAFSWCALPNASSFVSSQIPRNGSWCFGASFLNATSLLRWPFQPDAFQTLRDMNNDGLSDAVFRNGSALLVAVNAGSRFLSPQKWFTFPAEWNSAPSDKHSLLDYNGDGLVDLQVFTASNPLRLALSTGSALRAINMAELSSVVINGTALLTDVTGDNLQDLVQFDDRGTTVYINLNAAPRLTKATDSYGNVKEIIYGTTANQTHYSANADRTTPLANFPVVPEFNPSPIVLETSESDGVGGYKRSRFKYERLKVDKLGGGSQGFESITETDWPGSSERATKTSFHQQFPLSGMTKAEESRINDILIEKRERQYLVRNLTGSESFARISQVFLTRETSDRFELSGQYVATTVIEKEGFDQFGNAPTIRKTVKGLDITMTRICETKNNYSNWPEAWHLARLDSKNQSCWFPNASQPRLATRSETYTYHQFSRQMATKEYHARTNGSLLCKYEQNPLGLQTYVSCAPSNPVSKTLPRTQISIYDTSGLLLVSQTNGLNHTEHYRHNAAGDRISFCDANGLETQYVVDAFSRVQIEVQPDGTEHSIALRFDNAEAVDGAKYTVIHETTSRPTTYIFYDSYEREIRREEQSSRPGIKVVSQKDYSREGHIARVSSPCYEGEIDKQVWTVTSVDALGRKILQERTKNDATISNSTTRTIYRPLETQYIQPNGATTVHKRNLDGKVVKVISPSGVQTEFTYDAWEQLLKHTDAEGNTIEAAYDDRGFQNMLKDPDLGQLTYKNDEYGNVIEQTDANENRVSFVFDQLNRLVRSVRPEGVVERKYDSAPHGVGKLASVGFDQAVKSYRYDELSRQVGEELQVKQGDTGETMEFEVQLSYDEANQLAAEQYVGGPAIFYCYSKGFLQRVQNECCNSPSKGNYIYWKALERHASGDIYTEKLGNELENRFSYNEETSQPLRSETVAPDGRWVRNIRYDVDMMGNMRSREDAVAQTQEFYSYDLDSRLLSSVFRSLAPGLEFAFAEHWRWDRIGRMLSWSGLGPMEYQYSQSKPHAIVAAGIHTVDHDQNGNVVRKDDINLTYTSFNKPALIVSPDHTVRYFYDGDQTQYLQQKNEERVWSFRNMELLERPDAGLSVIKHFIQVEGRLVAVHATKSSFAPPSSTAPPSSIAPPPSTAPPSSTVVPSGSRSPPLVTAGPPLLTAGPANATALVAPNRSAQAGSSQNFGNAGHPTTQLTATALAGDSHPGPSMHEILYIHKDYLDNLDTVTDERGNVVGRILYNPFGVERPADLRHLKNMVRQGSMYASGIHDIFNSTWDRGFKGHRSAREFGFINMGGRWYDPVLGFLSPDPVIQDRFLYNNANRYSHFMGNPLKYKDPTGFFFRRLFRAIRRAFSSVAKPIRQVVVKPIIDVLEQAVKPILGGLQEIHPALVPVVAVVGTIVTVGALGPVALAAMGAIGLTGSVAAATAGALTGAASGFVSGFLATGKVTGGFREMGAAALTGGVGSYFSSASVAKLIATSAAKGIGAEWKGGDFKDGLIMGAITGSSSLAYSKAVGFSATWKSGGEAVWKDYLTRPVEGANNVGIQGHYESLDADSWGLQGLNEGGRYSVILNKIPGVNAIAGMHDTMQVEMGAGLLRDVTNVPFMIPATAITLGALADPIPLGALED